MFLKNPNTFETLVYARHIDHHNSLYVMYGSSFRYMKIMFWYASDCGAADHYLLNLLRMRKYLKLSFL